MTFAVRPLQSSIGGIVNLTSGNSFNNSLSGIGGTATATVRLSLNGSLYLSQNASLVAVTGQWRRNGVSSQYEAQGTWQNPTGAAGTTGGPTGWVSLSTTRDWTFAVSNSSGSKELLVELRLASNGMPLTSAVILVEVDSAL